MKKNNKITPTGFRDYLFEESEAENEIKRRMAALFSRRGFHQVITPTLEFLDVFQSPEAVIPSEQMYKLCDSRGRLMALRPDITLPIARLAATRLKEMPAPIRLCYTERVFRVNPDFNGRRDEGTQSGVELLGAKGKRADLEILSLALQTLEQCGASDFKIEIGHAGFFKSVIRQLDTDEQQAETIRSLIESKCYAALEDELAQVSDQRVAAVLRRMPRLFGGIEVLDEAAALCGDLCTEPLEYLREIYHDLQNMPVSGEIYLDLGLVHRNAYYTGVLFRGYIAGSGATVLTGGRYDELLAAFGADMAAIGFAADNDALAQLLALGGQQIRPKTPDVLVFGAAGYEMPALIRCQALVGQGLTVENSIFGSVDESVEYARVKGIPRLIMVDEETVEMRI